MTETPARPCWPRIHRRCGDFVQTRLRTTDHADDVIQPTLLRASAHCDQLLFRNDRPTISLREFPRIDSHNSGPSPLASQAAVPSGTRYRMDKSC